MPHTIFGDLRIPYQADGTQVFHNTGIYDAPSTEYKDLTSEEVEYLNSDRLFSLEMSRFDLSQPGNIYLSQRITFFFPELMDITGVTIGAVGYQDRDQDVHASVSSDTVGLADGTWTDMGSLLLATRIVQGGTFVGDEMDIPRTIALNDHVSKTGYVLRIYTAHRQVVWDTPAEPWTKHPAYDLGMTPLYGKGWTGIKAIMFYTVSDRGLGENLNIHLHGRPTFADDAGLIYQRADGSPLRPRDLDFGTHLVGSAESIIGPFRMKNTTAQTAMGTVATVAGTREWAYTEITDPAYDPEHFSPVMPYITARIGGGAWTPSTVSGKKIELAVGDLAPGETSDEIEIRFLPPVVLERWTLASLLLSAVVGAWVT